MVNCLPYIPYKQNKRLGSTLGLGFGFGAPFSTLLLQYCRDSDSDIPASLHMYCVLRILRIAS